jgi:hypothetical protein
MWSLGAGIGTAGANVGLERKLGPALWLVADAAAQVASTSITRPDPEIDGQTLETQRDQLTLSAAVDVGVRFFFVEAGPVRPSIHVTGGPFVSQATSTAENTTFLDDDTDSTKVDILDQTLGLSLTAGGAVDVPFFDDRLAVRVATDVVRGVADLRHNEVDVDEAQKTDQTDLSLNLLLSPSIEIRVSF